MSVADQLAQALDESGAAHRRWELRFFRGHAPPKNRILGCDQVVKMLSGMKRDLAMDQRAAIIDDHPSMADDFDGPLQAIDWALGIARRGCSRPRMAKTLRTLSHYMRRNGFSELAGYLFSWANRVRNRTEN